MKVLDEKTSKQVSGGSYENPQTPMEWLRWMNRLI